MTLGLLTCCGSDDGCKLETSCRRFDFEATFGSAVRNLLKDGFMSLQSSFISIYDGTLDS